MCRAKQGPDIGIFLALMAELVAKLTCPACGRKSVETMPTTGRVGFYTCAGCDAVLTPKPGDCCVICSYSDTRCPSVQDRTTCAGPASVPARVQLMTDDRDWSWLNRSAPAPTAGPAAERRLWIVVKDARSAQAFVRDLPYGQELRIVMAGELLWSQLFRPGDAPTLTDVAATDLARFLARGWEPAE